MTVARRSPCRKDTGFHTLFHQKHAPCFLRWQVSLVHTGGIHPCYIRSHNNRMLIDTHAHLYLDAFDDDREDVIDRAREAGVEAIVLPAIDVPSIHAALDLCARFAGLYAMAGLHPSATKEATEKELYEVADLCEEEAVVAVGESGLDYYWDRSFDDKQQFFLRQHIHMAAEKGLPLVLHNREATDDLLKIVGSEREKLDDPESLTGIFHCFVGTKEEGESIVELGFLLGLGGILTFKNSTVDEAVRELPLQKMVVETDAPYLAPEPRRGKRNEPAFVRHVAEYLADVKEMPFEDLAERTTQTARQIFGIDIKASTL